MLDYFGMSWRSAKIKLLSVFVLTFLCLNAEGALCVAYCQGAAKAEVKADHCPLAKFGAHCPKSKNSMPDAAAYVEFSDNSMDCCVLSVSLIAAPIEKRQNIVAVTPPTVIEPIRFYIPVKVPVNERVYLSGYSPPLADRQSTHLKNQVFRI